MSTGAIVLIVVVALVVPVGGILATLGVYGARKYIANAKTTEARNVIGELARRASHTYDATHSLCPSASAPVPTDTKSVRGKAYQSTPSDWQVDARRNAGFACLEFEIHAPQYFQYTYDSSSTGFVVRARGDLNGDGFFSTFEIHGTVVGEHVVLSEQTETRSGATEDPLRPSTGSVELLPTTK